MEPHPTPPALCSGLDEVRAGMDSIDRQIVDLLSRRVQYVRAAAAFKTSSAAVAAPERVAAVLKTRREWAEAAGLNGDVIEALYREIIAYSISEEHAQWAANRAHPDHSSPLNAK